MASGPEHMEFNPTGKAASGEHCLELSLDGLSCQQADDDFGWEGHIMDDWAAVTRKSTLCGSEELQMETTN